MGSFVSFKCKFCQYEEPNIVIGHGKAALPFLALYSCDHCKTIGSAWIAEGKAPRCNGCYNDALTMLTDDTRKLSCPKCGETAAIMPKEGGWE